MADTTTILSVCTTVESKLASLAVTDGQLIFVRDKHKVALDFGGKRTEYNQIEELATEAVRTAMLAPVKGRYYFVLDTGVLWTYQDAWVQITTPPKNVKYYFTSLALAKAAAATAVEMDGTGSDYFFGMKLLVDDGVNAKWYTIQRGGVLLEDGVSFTTDETLIFSNGVLKVNTTNVAEADNTLPITSAGVHTQLGNINVLLNTI